MVSDSCNLWCASRAAWRFHVTVAVACNNLLQVHTALVSGMYIMKLNIEMFQLTLKWH
jgi:hypothetical protein